MKVIYDLCKSKEKFQNAVMAIGVFDGVHLGHKKLIKKIVQKAKSLNGDSVVMTFSPHPVHVLHPEVYLPLVVSLRYRLKLIESLGVSKCIVIEFTKVFSQLSPQEFVKKYLVEKIKPVEVFVGDEFRFGQNREGSLEYFKNAGKKFGFKVNGIDPVAETDKRKIGSSLIRELVSEGRLDDAGRLLDRPVSILEVVKKGDGRGKDLGFPTANLYPQTQTIPPIGVYAVKIIFSKKEYNGMANVGKKPSFKKNDKVNVEIHVFDFHKDLYDKEILVQFIQKIRNEKKFTSKSKLIEQLKSDEKKARAILNNG